MRDVLAKGLLLYEDSGEAMASPDVKRETRSGDYYPTRISVPNPESTGTLTFAYRNSKLGEVIIDSGEGRGEQYWYYPNGHLKQAVTWDREQLKHYAFYEAGNPKNYMCRNQSTRSLTMLNWNDNGQLLQEPLTLEMPLRLNVLYRPPRSADMTTEEQLLFQHYVDRYEHYNLGGGLIERSGQEVLSSTKTHDTYQAIVRFDDDGSTASITLSQDRRIALSFQQYKSGNKEGWGYDSYESGRPQAIWRIEGDGREGKLIELFPDGMPKAIYLLSNDKRIKTESLWDPNGNRAITLSIPISEY